MQLKHRPSAGAMAEFFSEQEVNRRKTPTRRDYFIKHRIRQGRCRLANLTPRLNDPDSSLVANGQGATLI